MKDESCLPRGFRNSALFFLALFIAGPFGLLYARQSMEHFDQILIVRELAHEVAVAKIPLPWGKHGVHVNSQGEIDQTQAAKELREKGMSVKPGRPVEITGIKFRPGRIVFAINGGGKSGEHWYQHLEIGMGPMPVPVASSENPTTPSNGSYITLQLPKNDPHPTAEQVKTLLSEVLDFSRRAPTVLYSPSVPPQFKDAIQKHQVVIGMSKSAVLSAKGPPDRKIREDKPDGTEEEDWLYGQPPHVLFVIFNEDSVVRVHQY